MYFNKCRPLLKKFLRNIPCPEKGNLILKRNGRTTGFIKQKVCPSTKEISSTVSQTNIYTTRTHTCGELRSEDEHKNVLLCGWLQFQRINFAVLRDGYGKMQVVIPHNRDDLKKILENIPLESVIQVEGVVNRRPNNNINKNMSTGEIEIIASNIISINKADKQIPFHIRNYSKAKEDLRMKYRYLDFRFPEMQHNLRFRSSFLMKVRQFLIQERDFVEVETPTLFKRTPGGAREFVVPTHEENKYYSLVQSPQQLKQLLMVGSIDRYFQIARCYRDESTKPDRQPEFTQLDIELSFTNREYVMNLIEDLLCFCLKIPPQTFPKLSYEDVMNNYGTDKPDLRYDCKIMNIDKYLRDSLPSIESTNRMLILENGQEKLTNKIMSQYHNLSKSNDVKLTVLKVKEDSDWLHKLERLYSNFDVEAFKNEFQINVDDVLVLARGKRMHTLSLLGQIRTDFHKDIVSKYSFKMGDSTSFSIFWVVDFPLFLSTDGVLLESTHHPFTQPHPDDLHLLQTEPLKVRGLHYDLVLNGNEIGGGSIRIHNSDMQETILKLLNIETSSLDHMLQAFKYGCPPHGGIALGIDRLMSILCATQTIRDVIAFPKGYGGKDLLSGAPNTITKEEKEYYHLK